MTSFFRRSSSSMLGESIQKVQSIVDETKNKVDHLIQDGKRKVDVGTRVANDWSLVLDEIVQTFSSVTQMANEISIACNEQSLGVREITKAVNELDQVTQDHAATSHKTAKSQ
jgi:methyl-accepting chemotaxis protein